MTETDASEQQHGDGDNVQTGDQVHGGGDVVQGDKVVTPEPAPESEGDEG